MALITDPDQISPGTDVAIDTANKTIKFEIVPVIGNLTTDGVTGQALYSWLKEQWRTNPSLIAFDFPMVAITPEQFEFVEGWEPLDNFTRNLIRTAGWREIAPGGAIKREYMGAISLGTIDAGDVAYYAFSSQSSKTDFAFDGPVNQGVQTYGDPSNGNFDYRNDTLTLYIRTQGKLFGTQTTTDIGVTGLSYIAYRFPLSEAVDLKISASDNTIANNSPYTGMSIEYDDDGITRTIGGSSYNFGVVIDGNGGTAEEIYEYIQYQLRQNATIDTKEVNGLLAESLIEFVGDSLETLLTSVGGVYIDNFNSNDTNRITFTDNTGAGRTFPFVAAGSINFNSNLQADASAIYRVFYTTNPAGDFGTSSALLVQDNAGLDLSGTIGGAGSISFDFDYDGNNQGGRTPGTDADVTIVSIGLDSAQYVVATGTITRATGLSFSLVAPLERNYSNP